MNRYGIALLVACASVGAGLLFCFIIRRWIRSYDGFDVEVSPAQMRLILLADLLSQFWFIWIPLCIAACIAVAWFTRA